MTLSRDAKQLFIASSDKIENQLGENSPLSIVSSNGAKIADIAVRIAGVLTLAGDVHAQIIDTEAMSNAIELGQFYLSEILRITETGMADPDILKAEKLLTWLRDKKPRQITLRDILRLGPNALRSKKEAEVATKVLTEHGWLTPDGKKNWKVRYA